MQVCVSPSSSLPSQVNSYAPNMVRGMLALLRNCPQEVAHLRRELLIAARHILATDLRSRFIENIDQLFDEDLLIGTGWTTKETARSLAYSILADLVHHIRTHLKLSHLSLAVHLFSKNVHDDSLPVGIQTMSCKLLLNLVDSIRLKAEQEPAVSNLPIPVIPFPRSKYSILILLLVTLAFSILTFLCFDVSILPFQCFDVSVSPFHCRPGTS